MLEQSKEKLANVQYLPEAEWSDNMCDLADLTKRIANLTIGCSIKVTIYTCKNGPAADYLHGILGFNLSCLGRNWFRAENREAQFRLIIHELGHEYGGHLDEAYYNGLAKIGAKLALLSPSEILGK